MRSGYNRETRAPFLSEMVMVEKQESSFSEKKIKVGKRNMHTDRFQVERDAYTKTRRYKAQLKKNHFPCRRIFGSSSYCRIQLVRNLNPKEKTNFEI